MVDRAIAAGEVRPETDPDVLFDAIAGAVLLRLLVSPDDSPDFVEHLGDILLAGVFTGGRITVRR
jgi:hypothetical protein